MSSGYIKVGPNPLAQIIAFHPLAVKVLSSVNLGDMNESKIFDVHSSCHQRALELFSLSHHFENFDRQLEVPIETG